MIKNPILKGFNPDPSICRVGDDYYIATSTFQWFPGVQIYHSKDLANWELVSHPLTRKRSAPAAMSRGGVFYFCGGRPPAQLRFFRARDIIKLHKNKRRSL